MKAVSARFASSSSMSSTLMRTVPATLSAWAAAVLMATVAPRPVPPTTARSTPMWSSRSTTSSAYLAQVCLAGSAQTDRP
ncbi:hypothetical protein N599_01350 [Saccharopolyspora erythraea D]|nr:hypothetical protein [Saccharopolyspora erythraea]EQD88133.1 hypothetical protein N599_01350 [Saccharopolyspora erythraea D]